MVQKVYSLRGIGLSGLLLEDHAFYLDCTPHTPANRCVDGKIPITAKTLFHGQVPRELGIYGVAEFD